MRKNVFLLTSGSGDDGEEWRLLGVYSTKKKAVHAKTLFEKPRLRSDNNEYVIHANEIEEWPIDEV